jgi:hypothetical protein
MTKGKDIGYNYIDTLALLIYWSRESTAFKRCHRCNMSCALLKFLCPYGISLELPTCFLMARRSLWGYFSTQILDCWQERWDFRKSSVQFHFYETSKREMQFWRRDGAILGFSSSEYLVFTLLSFLSSYMTLISYFFIPMLCHCFALYSKLRVSKVAVCCFSWGISYDFYGVKTAAGG